jgi:hypothetical protein
MNLTLMLLLQSYPHRAEVTSPSPRPLPSPRHQEPGPEGAEGEPAGDDDADEDEEPETLRDAPTSPVPPAHGPVTPDANAVDPRVFS